MAIDRSEANKIIEQHRRLLNKLESYNKTEEQLKHDVISASDAYIAKQAGKALQADSDANVKIKISITKENKNVIEVKKLLQALYNYREFKTTPNEAASFAKANRPAIEKAISEVEAGLNVGGFKKLFAGGTIKKAEESFAYLKGALSGDYAKKANELLGDKSDALIWADFEKNSASYFTTLEQVRPGLTGTGDGEYKLPKDLAEEIAKQAASLDGLNVELRRYQEWGVKYALHQQNMLLGDEMGLGKTVQAIATMVSLHNAGATHFIVVCPASVLTNWIREVTKMSSLPVIKIHGSDREKSLELWKNEGGVAITTYETTGHFDLADDFKFSLLVVDEAHYIKNPSAQRTQNVASISKHADRKLFMTGTALENRLDEMINLVTLLQPDVASKIKSLVASKTVGAAVNNIGGSHKDLGLIKYTPEFQQALAPVYFRREREEVLGELPELIDTKEWCTLLPEEKKVYEQAVMNSKFTESRRVSWTAEDLSKSSKAIRFKELVEEAADDGRKVIVFSFFLDTIQKVQSVLGDRCIGPINGSIPPAKRQEMVDEFNEAPEGAVLISQIQAGGTGLNIQAASVVILCEPQLKPSIENQAISRAYRMGQTRNVLVYRLLCDNTVDEEIVKMLEDKQKVFDAFAGDSVSGNESLELDEKTFGNILSEEIARIKAENEGA